MGSKTTKGLLPKIAKGVAQLKKPSSLSEGLETPAFSKNEKQNVTPLCYLVVVVNEGQDGAIIKIIYDCGGSVCFSCHGEGTASSDLYDVLGLSNTKKRVVLSPIPENVWSVIKRKIEERFAASQWAKGIAYLVDIDSICGTSSYRFLTNDRNQKKNQGGIMEEQIEKKNDYEVVMAIVNDGFTDLVMEAAWKAGARGGTILTARGTGNKDIEKYFGVAITPEKQIVMILVPKAIKDAVITAIYKDVGINTKGQGIAFSFPASDVIGIVEKGSETQEEKAESKEEDANDATVVDNK
jgi:nitrogen regulatory protein PII